MKTATDRSTGPSFLNLLSVKIGAAVGALGAVSTLLGPDLPLWSAALVGVALGGATYVIAHHLLHRRLARLRSTLKQIREHEFDDLPSPPSTAGDEIDLLRWEVLRTGRALDDEIRELQEMESYRREFIGNVSHELKTPIFSVQGFTETLLDGALEDDDVNRTFLKKILHNVNRLENLARDLSTITKIETDELEMSSEAFSVGEAFQTARESVELKAKEKDVTLRQDLAAELPEVYGDKNRIGRVLVNLTENAIKYNEEGGTVELRARQVAAGVQICVADDGIGIPEEHLPRLTERFYRVDKSRSRNQGGTGLGLAIVKHILAAHDTRLQVESTPGEGSTFCFTLSTTPVSTLEPISP